MDITDGFTKETGLSSGFTIEISKAGASQGSGSGSITEIGDGAYYYEFTSGEVDTLGFVHVSIRHASCRDVDGEVQVVAYDPYSATNLGLSLITDIDAKTTNIPTDPASETNVNANETKLDTVITETNKIQTVLDDTNEMQGKLPTQYFMGSSSQSSYSNNIDSIEQDTNEIQTKLPQNFIMGSSVITPKDDEINDIKAKTDGLNFDGNNVLADVMSMNTDVITAAAFAQAAADKVWDTVAKIITGGILTTPNDYKATGFSTHSEPDLANLDVAVSTRSSHSAPTIPTVGQIDTELTTQHGSGSWTTGGGGSAPTEQEIWEYVNRSLTTPADYKATGFSVPNEYDIVIGALQTDLDNPDQYKANITALALEATVQAIKTLTDNLPADTEAEIIKIQGTTGLFLLAEYHRDGNGDNDYIDFWQFSNSTDLDNETKANKIHTFRLDSTYTSNRVDKSKWKMTS